MNVNDRILICRMLEQMKGQERFCTEIGISDGSTFKNKSATVNRDSKTKQERRKS